MAGPCWARLMICDCSDCNDRRLGLNERAAGVVRGVERPVCGNASLGEAAPMPARPMLGARLRDGIFGDGVRFPIDRAGGLPAPQATIVGPDATTVRQAITNGQATPHARFFLVANMVFPICSVHDNGLSAWSKQGRIPCLRSARLSHALRRNLVSNRYLMVYIQSFGLVTRTRKPGERSRPCRHFEFGSQSDDSLSPCRYPRRGTRGAIAAMDSLPGRMQKAYTKIEAPTTTHRTWPFPATSFYETRYKA